MLWLSHFQSVPHRYLPRRIPSRFQYRPHSVESHKLCQQLSLMLEHPLLFWVYAGESHLHVQGDNSLLCPYH